MRSWLFTISPRHPPALPIAVKPCPSLKSMHIVMSKITKNEHMCAELTMFDAAVNSQPAALGGGVNLVAPLNVAMHVCWSTTAFVPLTGWWIRSPGWWPGWFGCLFWSSGALVPACPGEFIACYLCSERLTAGNTKTFSPPPPTTTYYTLKPKNTTPLINMLWRCLFICPRF